MSSVDEAFVLVFPTNEWSCDAPGLPKKTIGSSGARCVKVQLDTKFTPRSRSFMRSFESSPASADETTSAETASGASKATTSRRSFMGHPRGAALSGRSKHRTVRNPCAPRKPDATCLDGGGQLVRPLGREDALERPDAAAVEDVLRQLVGGYSIARSCDQASR